MRAGQLKHRVTIQKNEKSQGPLGEPINKWVDIATVWAEVKGIGGRDLIAGGTQFNEATMRIWMRYRPDVTTENRIKFQQTGVMGPYFGIQAVLPDNDRTRLELLCKGGM